MATEEHDNHHIKNEPGKMDTLADALRKTQASRQVTEGEMKKRLEERMTQAVEEYINHLGLTEHITEAALKGLTEARVNLKAPFEFFKHPNYSQPFLTEHNTKMNLKYQKSWIEFFDLLIQTIKVGPFRKSELSLPNIIDGTVNHDSWGGVPWNARYHHFDEVRRFSDIERNTIPHVFTKKRNMYTSGYSNYCICGRLADDPIHSQEAIWPSKLILKWSSGRR